MSLVSSGSEPEPDKKQMKLLTEEKKTKKLLTVNILVGYGRVSYPPGVDFVN